MQKLIKILFMTAILAITGSCTNDSPDELPASVTAFLEQYFAGENYTSKTVDSGYIVNVDNGATLQFDTDGAWTDIDGNGGTLSDMLLYNILPSQLYEYLVMSENLDGVYRVSRLMDVYTVYFVDSEVKYNSSTGQFVGN